VAKAAIESLLLGEFGRDDGVPAVVLHPGHISGPGWPVINPAGNLDLGVWERLATGRRVVLPNLGLETLHHVHADDVAQAFELAIAHRERAVGRSFHVVSDRAITLRGFAEAVASWFGQEADLEFRPFDDFRASTTPEHAATTFEHIARSHSMSIDAAAERLGYAPGATSLEAVREALEWLSEHGKVNLWTV
jgi:nucleoside-diphosphate-sugar epimerase